MKKMFTITTLGLAGMLTSCQTTTGTPQSAVTCDKCRTVYFKDSSGINPSNKGFVALRDASRMECAECENQVIAWVKTGSLSKHTCNSCGGKLHHCKNH